MCILPEPRLRYCRILLGKPQKIKRKRIMLNYNFKNKRRHFPYLLSINYNYYSLLFGGFLREQIYFRERQLHYISLQITVKYFRFNGLLIKISCQWS